MTDFILDKIEYPAVGESLYQATLSNQLRLFLLPKKGFKENYVNLTVRFGSIDTTFTENQTRSVLPYGVAHFLEHKIFAAEDGTDFLQKFSQLGADSNAFTSFTQTSYVFSTTDHLIENLTLLVEMISSLHLDSESVAKEKKIVEQERQSYQDDPDDRLFVETLAHLYPETPLAEEIVGSESSIQEITIEDLEKAFTSFYHPSRLGLFVVGDFDVEEVAQKVSEEFDKENFTEVSSSCQDLSFAPVRSAQSMRMEVASPKLAVGLRGKDEIFSHEILRYKTAIKLLTSMLFGWTSKRFQSWYEEGKIDQSFSIDLEVEEAFHFLILTLDTNEPFQMSRQLRLALQNFAEDKDVNEDHLDIVKSELFGRTIEAFDDLSFVATEFRLHQEGENLFDLPKILQDLSLDDVLDYGKRFIGQCDMIDFTIFPKN